MNNSLEFTGIQKDFFGRNGRVNSILRSFEKVEKSTIELGKVKFPELNLHDTRRKRKEKKISSPSLLPGVARNSIKIIRNCSQTPTYKILSPCFITKKVFFSDRYSLRAKKLSSNSISKA